MMYALIVIYNKACENSETLNSIYKWKDKIEIVIFDNSTKSNNNQAYCQREEILYFTEKKNLGLSKAYNYVIDRLSLNDDDYIIILDDDTVLSDEYIEEVLRSQHLDKDILLPIVRCNDKIISPTNIKFKCGSKIVKSIKDLKFDNMSAINSGMVICGRVFKNIRYNEDLFLDCVDHEFMRMVRNNKFSIYLLKNGIIQNFSRNEKPAIENALFRFKLYKADFKKYCKINNATLYYYLSIFKFLLVYSFRYRSLKFLTMYLKDRE